LSDQAAQARAEALLAVGRTTPAIELLCTALAASPHSYSLLCTLSYAYLQACEWEWAREIAERCIAVSPATARPFRLLSAALVGAGDPAGAACAAEEAVSLEPLEWRNHAQLASALGAFQTSGPMAGEDPLVKKGRRSRQLRFWGIFIVVVALCFVAMVAVLDIMAGQQGQLPGSIAGAFAVMMPLFLVALALHVIAGRLRRQVAAALAPQDSADEASTGLSPASRALVAARHAVSLGPDEPDAHVAVGDAAAGMGRTGESIAAYRRALSLRPGDAVALNNLSAVQLNRGRLLAAAGGLLAAVATQPDLRIAEYNLRVIASRFVRWFNFGVLVLYMVMGLLMSQSRSWGGAVAIPCLLVLVAAAVTVDLRLPPALRSYYRRLAIRDHLFGVRVGLLVAAFVLSLCELLPVSAPVYDGLRTGVWFCLLAGMGAALAHAEQLKTQREVATGGSDR
jgi:tetratricopeptide (TPR) repeat protein